MNNSTYDDLHSDEKNKLKEYLIQEQHFLCAYCMSRIKLENSTIEHYIPRKGENGNPALSLNYKNMFSVCYNDRYHKSANPHCDVSKGDKLLHIDPQKQCDIDTIEYQSDGTISSTKAVFKDDLNNILNLNVSNLKNNRYYALNTALNEIKKRSNGGWNKAFLQKCLEKYSQKNVEYVGIIIYMLKKRLKRNK